MRFPKRTLALYLISQSSISYVLSAHRRPLDVLRLQLATSSERFRSILADWSAADYQHYLDHFRIDLIHPMIYGSLLYFLLRWVGARGWIFALPVVAAICDEVENLSHIYLLMRIDRFPEGLWYVAVTASYMKWTAVLAALVYVAGRGWSRRGRLPVDELASRSSYRQ